MGDRASMMAALQKFAPQGQPSALPPMAGGQVPRTGGVDPLPQGMPRMGGPDPLPQQQAMGASVAPQQGPLKAQTVLQALNAGARPQAIGRGYGFRK